MGQIMIFEILSEENSKLIAETVIEISCNGRVE